MMLTNLRPRRLSPLYGEMRPELNVESAPIPPPSACARCLGEGSGPDCQASRKAGSSEMGLLLAVDTLILPTYSMGL